MKNPFKPFQPARPAPSDGRGGASANLVEPDDPAGDADRERIARGDADLDARRAAVARLVDPARLLALFGDAHVRDALGSALRSRLAERFEAEAVGDALAAEFLAADTTALAPLVAARAAGPELRARALAALEDEAALVSVIEDSRFHDTRMAAAVRLEQDASMRAALGAARSRDKAVARLLQQRLEERTRLETARLDAARDRDATLEAIERLAGSVWSPQHGGRRQVLLDRWAALDAAVRAEGDAQARFAAADARLATAIAEHEPSEPSDLDGIDNASPGAVSSVDAAGAAGAAGSGSTGDDAAVPTARAIDAAQATDASSREPGADTAVLPLDDESRALFAPLAVVPLEGLAAAAADLQPAGERARALVAHLAAVGVLFDPPFVLGGSRPAAVQQRLARVDALLALDKLLPGTAASELPWIAPLVEHRAALEQRRVQARQESTDRLKATVRQFGVLSGLVKEGKWAPANSLFRRIEKKVGAMDDAERRRIAARLERARGELAEMSDWQDFAARPKLEETVMRMEALAANEQVAPPARARQVRELQAEWKSFGSSRASNELWPRFKTAADAAYAPCKAFFEERNKERDAKRQERVGIVEELEGAAAEATTEDGRTPDTRALQSRVSRARQAWSRTRIDDRKPDKSLEARFSAALKPFEAVLLGEYERNEAEKQSLVERMTELAVGDIDQHTANRAKSLQAAWKLVGPTRRKQDQALWEAFNERARTVFGARRDAARERSRSELAHVYRGREIVDELKKLGKRQPVDDTAVQALSTEFDALAEFPERDRKGLVRAYREALDGVSRQRESGAKRRAEAAREETRRLIGLCERVERAVEATSDGVDSGENPLTLREEILDAWENGGGEVSAPREVVQRLEQRRDAALAHLASGTAPDWDAGEDARRDLLIRMEVAADVETPAEDRSRRMRFQLAHLQEGMTSAGVSDRRATLSALEQDWLVAPPVRAALASALDSRYLRAMGR